MAKASMKVDEFKAYFQGIVAEYGETPMAEYFGKEIEEILEQAKTGLKAKNQAARQEIYDSVTMSINNLNKKIDNTLGEVVNNFKGRGGTSNLKGTFYYKSGDGDQIEAKIVEAAEAGVKATTLSEKSERFLETVDLFEDYVVNSSLNTALETTSTLNASDASKSLKVVYRNSIKAEQYWGYRKVAGGKPTHVHQLVEDNENIRSNLAAPFRYYTILAGIKTGEIKELTPEIINDLKWIGKSTKTPLFPAGFNADDPNLKTDKAAQGNALRLLASQYNESELKDKLIKARTDFSNDPLVISTRINETGRFKRGQFSTPRIFGLSGGVLAGVLIFLGGLAAQVAAGYEGNFIQLMGEYLSQSPINIALPIVVPGAIGGLVTSHYARSSHKLINRYNNLTAQKRNNLLSDVQLLSKIKNLSNLNDQELRQVATQLKGILNTNVYYVSETKANETLKTLKEGEVMITRGRIYMKGPENSKNDAALARAIAKNRGVFSADFLGKEHAEYAISQIVGVVNKNYDNVFGDKESEITRNMNALTSSINALQRETHTRVQKPALTKRGNEKTTTHSIDNREDIIAFANKLDLSHDGPFAAIMQNVLSKLPGYTPAKKPVLATGGETPESELENGENRPSARVQAGPIAETAVRNPAPAPEPVTQSQEEQIDMHLEEIKANVNALAYGFDAAIGSEEYSIDIETRGQIENIYDFNNKLEAELLKIKEKLLEGKRTYTVGISNTPREATKMSKKGLADFVPGKRLSGILPGGKKVVAGEDTVTIKVTKKSTTTRK